MQRFGAAAWIEQVAFGVMTAVQNGIENLSGSSVTGNAHPEDAYRFRARTAEELKATQHLVAPVKIEDLPPVDEIYVAPRVTPTPPVQKPRGWIL